MIGLPNSSLFRSRWKALLWAGGICLTAVSIAGHGGKGHKQAKSDDDTQAAMSDAINAMETP